MRSRIFVVTACLGLALVGTAAAQRNSTISTAGVAPAQRITDIPPAAAETSGAAPALNHLGARGAPLHILPNPAGQAARNRAGLNWWRRGNVNLQYHSGGPVITTANIYTIYWSPATLQTGAPTAMSAQFQTVLNALASVLPAASTAAAVYNNGKSLYNIAAQYYQISGIGTTYITDGSGLAGTYVDTSPYPASGCNDNATPGACLTDAQIQAEILKVIAANSWPTGVNNIYVLFTSSGEGSCISGSSSSCAYTSYCAYHSYISTTGGPVIYANMPYANPAACLASGQTTPNDRDADIVGNVTTHEIMEMVTDPLLNAWFDQQGNEIGDKCAWNFGANSIYDTSAGVSVNQYMTSAALGTTGGWFFDDQQEWSNANSGCVQVR